MELRNFSHFHYIQTLRGGSVIKILNVNSRRKPGLKLKKVNEIYDSLPKLETEDCCYRGFLLYRYQVKNESPCSSSKKRRLIKDEPAGDVDEVSGDINDMSFDSMTLMQIKDKCKRRVKKPSRNVNSSEKTVETFHPVEDFFDLEEPLCLWQSKLSRKKKGKCKLSTSDDSSLSPNALAIVKSEETVNLSPPSSELTVPCNIKVEIHEPDMNNFEEEVSLVRDEKEGSNGNLEADGANEFVSQSELSTSSLEEPECWYPSENKPQCYEPLDPKYFKPVQILWNSDEDFMNFDNPEIECLHLYWPKSESKEEDCAFDVVPYDVYPEATLTEDQYSLMLLCQGATDHQMICLNSTERIQWHEGDVSVSEDKSKDDVDELPSGIRPTGSTTSSIDNGSLSNDNHFVSVDDKPYPAKEEQSQISTCSARERKFSSKVHPLGTTDEFTAPYVESEDGNLKQPDTPQRLLSTRKAISPTSQERLCKAIESIELHDNKLTEESSPFGVATFATNSEPVILKSENNKELSTLEGTIKVPYHSRVSPRVRKESTSIPSFSESTIAFAQRQMQDIESVTGKLSNELKAMKEIVEDRLHVETHTATSLTYSADEVRMAVAKTTRVEASARKWLSVMARNCGRFCKIMRVSGDHASVSENVVVKKPRRISFADEAGGNLCQVKLIDS